MLTGETKRKLTAGAMFGLPVGIVLIAANVMAPPPPASEASGPAPVNPIIGLGPSNHGAAVTPQMTAAIAHIETLGEGSFGNSPLYHAARPGTPGVVHVNPGDATDPVFTIQLIMAASSGNIALIEGRKYRVGDEFAETGWIVIDIDAVSRSVSIENPRSGRVRRHTVTGGRNGANKASVVVKPPVSEKSDDSDPGE